jgi:hypothetical protein
MDDYCFSGLVHFYQSDFPEIDLKEIAERYKHPLFVYWQRRHAATIDQVSFDGKRLQLQINMNEQQAKNRDEFYATVIDVREKNPLLNFLKTYTCECVSSMV